MSQRPLFMVLIALGGCLGSLGCATYTVEPHVRMEGQDIALETCAANALLWVTPAFEHYTKEQVDAGDLTTWRFVLGPESVEMFSEGLGKIFSQVDVQRGASLPGGNVPSGVKVVVHPAIVDTKASFPVAFKFENYHATVKYGVKVYDKNGKILLDEIFEGKGVERGHVGYSSAGHDALPEALRQAMVSAMKQCLEAIASSPAIEQAIAQ